MDPHIVLAMPDKTMFASPVLATRGRPGQVWVGAGAAFRAPVAFAATGGVGSTLALWAVAGLAVVSDPPPLRFVPLATIRKVTGHVSHAGAAVNEGPVAFPVVRP